jgi:hypothetical protein
MSIEKGLKIASIIFASLGLTYILGVLLGGLSAPNYWIGVGIRQSYVQDLLTTTPIESTARGAFTFFCLSYVCTLASKGFALWEKYLE